MGGRGAGLGKSGGGGAIATNRVRSYNEILADLSVNTSPAEVDFMINNLYTESAMNDIDRVFGIRRNREGYVTSNQPEFNYPDAFARLYSSASNDKKKQVINIIKQDSRDSRG